MIDKAEIKRIKNLTSSRAERNANGVFVAEGQKLTEDLTASGLEAQTVYKVGQNISQAEMGRISALKTPTDTLAIFKKPEFNFKESDIALVLDGVQDPGNMGTIIRTADWFGVNTIYCSAECADVYSPKVIQATMGSLARVKVVYTDIAALLANAEKPVYGTFLKNAANIYSVGTISSGFIVMGSEGCGISDTVEATITSRIFIPRIGGGESLNVAIATAVCLSLTGKK